MKIESFYKLNKKISKLKIHSIDMLSWHLSKLILNNILPFYYKKKIGPLGKSARVYTNLEVIVSLTTFPDRMSTLPLVLGTLFRQTIRADRIILWLADSQYPDKETVSTYLEEYVKLGLEIRFCQDFRSHKKYYFSMLENPRSIIVTCDDDILYSEYMLERLLSTHAKYPNMIVCERAHEMRTRNGKVMAYQDWNYRARGATGPSKMLCPTGGAGCLYPPNTLSSHVFEQDVFKKICYYADDIWLKCMSYLVDTPVVLTGLDNPEIIDTIGTNKNGLAKINVEQNLNDKQFEAVTQYYKIEWKKTPNKLGGLE